MSAQTSGKPRKLAECTESKCTSLVIAHVNIRSMRNKVDELQLLLKKLSIDIMCVSETWLNDTITDNTVNIAGYNNYILYECMCVCVCVSIYSYAQVCV